MKIIGFIVSGISILFGVLFMISAFGEDFRGGDLVVGLILVVIGLIIIWLITRKKAEQKEVTYKVDLGGDINVNKMTCQFCGGALDAKNVTLVTGVPTVKCPYCGNSYQITEEPKW